jgi:hypothetical protein
MRDLLEDIGLPVCGPTPLLIDNKSAIELTHDPVAFKKTKHILRAANELRDKVARDVFAPTFVEGTKQRADVLTKPLGPVGTMLCTWRAYWPTRRTTGVNERMGRPWGGHPLWCMSVCVLDAARCPRKRGC